MSKIMSTQVKILKLLKTMQGGKHLKYDTAFEILEQHSTNPVNFCDDSASNVLEKVLKS